MILQAETLNEIAELVLIAWSDDNTEMTGIFCGKKRSVEGVSEDEAGIFKKLETFERIAFDMIIDPVLRGIYTEQT